MKNMMLALAAAGLLAAPSGALAAQPQPAPAACDFILGFKTLQALDPGDIGTCLDNQAFASNGDALQHTTKGLMVWRKSDNWTAFTNGYTTWINGPDGLVNRLNSGLLFPWEHPQASQAPATAAGPAQTGAPPSGTCTPFAAAPANLPDTSQDFAAGMIAMKSMLPCFPLQLGTHTLGSGVTANCTGSAADIVCNESDGSVIEQVTAVDGSLKLTGQGAHIFTMQTDSAGNASYLRIDDIAVGTPA